MPHPTLDTAARDNDRCVVCNDPLADSFAPSPDGRCDTCIGYRRPPRPFRSYLITAHCAAAGFARTQRRRSRRRAYASA